jgi:hypothetical protein
MYSTKGVHSTGFKSQEISVRRSISILSCDCKGSDRCVQPDMESREQSLYKEPHVKRLTQNLPGPDAGPRERGASRPRQVQEGRRESNALGPAMYWRYGCVRIDRLGQIYSIRRLERGDRGEDQTLCRTASARSTYGVRSSEAFASG